MLRGRRSFIGLLVVGLMLFGVLSQTGVQVNQVEAKDSPAVVISQEQATIQAVEDVGPAVVSIVVTNIVRGYDFFNRVIEQPVEGLGSGFIFDERGYILTNNHVIQGAEEIKVILTDKREFEAEVVGADARNDLAVLKLKLEGKNVDLPIAKLGDSDQLRVGQMTIAIGTPYDLDFQNTVTTGVVSALGRSLQSKTERGYVEINNVIQTDASINPGNSGGPLLDSQGRVIGINTAILGNAQGLGFAVPINTAKDILDDLIEYGHVRRPMIGILGTDVNKEMLREYFGFEGDGGVYIRQVIPNGPAHAAGLHEGDLILEVDRKKITNMKELVQVVEENGIGATVKVLVLNKQGLDVKTVTIGESEENYKQAENR